MKKDCYELVFGKKKGKGTNKGSHFLPPNSASELVSSELVSYNSKKIVENKEEQ